MKTPLCVALAVVAMLAAAVAHAQPAPAIAPELARQCAELPAQAQDARSLARRAQCLLAGALPSERRFAEARELSRKSLQMGDPAGGFLLYVAFSNDPENLYVRDGKVDIAAYRRLAARTLEERSEQIEALEALAFAANKGHVNAAIALATYFYETVAPRNIERVLGLATLYTRHGENSPALHRMAQRAGVVLQAGPTKASIKAFIDAHQHAVAAAGVGYMARNSGKTCDRFAAKVLDSGEVQGAEYLPLKNKSVENTYLMRGQWVENWQLTGCEQQIPLTMTFVADGWGGSTFTASVSKPN